jgi:Ribbon-helix-helix protein, copG family
MKRTTIYLDPEIEVLLKLEALRRGEPMSELIRDALRAYLGRRPAQAPPGAGAFDSGHSDTAERAEDLLEELSFPEKD